MPNASSQIQTDAPARALQTPLRIVYVGPPDGTCRQRGHALERLGHKLVWIDAIDWIGHSRWTYRWLARAGAFGVGLKINRSLFNAIKQAEPDLIWVDQAEYLDRNLIAKLRSLSVPIVNYTIDDPFGGRDGLRFNNYLGALPYYDLVAVPRQRNVAEAYARGARNVQRIYMSADEIAHRPRVITDEDMRKWGSEVCFVGTWFPERGPFMTELIRAGLPLSIWGARWQKAPEWPVIAPHWRGPNQTDPEIYAKIIQCAKISLGLLSKGNRDLHTTRTFEIPAIGGLFCAERTNEHCAAYKEDVEAVFWSDAQECVAQCRRLLSDDALIASIKRNGRRRYLISGYGNESVLATILDHVASLGLFKKEPADAFRSAPLSRV